jgi:hypothetical protein
MGGKFRVIFGGLGIASINESNTTGDTENTGINAPGERRV